MKKLLIGTTFLFMIFFISGCSSADELAEKDEQIAELEQKISTQNSQITQQQEEIQSLQEEIVFWGWGVQRFANQLDRSTPEKVAILYAMTLQNKGDYAKNGALQYGLLSEDFKKEMLDTYRAFGWGSRGSSPWVENYKIVQNNMADAQTATVTISLTWKTSNDNGIPAETKLYMTKDENDDWVITKIE